MTTSLESAMERLNSQSDEADKIIKSLNGRIDGLHQDLQKIQAELDE